MILQERRNKFLNPRLCTDIRKGTLEICFWRRYGDIWPLVAMAIKQLALISDRNALNTRSINYRKPSPFFEKIWNYMDIHNNHSDCVVKWNVGKCPSNYSISWNPYFQFHLRCFFQSCENAKLQWQLPASVQSINYLTNLHWRPEWHFSKYVPWSP